MNQAILFNDDLTFSQEQDAWSCTAILSGQIMTIYFHSMQLKQLSELDSCTKFDLEEAVEVWLEKNEPEGDIISLEFR